MEAALPDFVRSGRHSTQVISPRLPRGLARNLGDPASNRDHIPSAVTRLRFHGQDAFQEEHPEVVSLYDIVHQLSRLIDALLSQETQGATFRQECCRCRHAIRQSPLSHLYSLTRQKIRGP